MTLSPDTKRGLDDLRRRFVYKADGRVDSFRILSAGFGPLEGDCDDFAVTALWIVAGKSMLRFWWLLIRRRAAIWRTFTPRGQRHAVLWCDGLGFIDNIRPQWAAESVHSLRKRRSVVKIAAKMAVGKIMGKR